MEVKIEPVEDAVSFLRYLITGNYKSKYKDNKDTET